MKTKMSFRLDAILLAFALTTILMGCTQKDVYVPDPTPTEPTLDAYFSFSTSDILPLSISYGVKDHQVAFEIYDTNPLTIIDDYNYTKANLEPILSGYTDWDSSYSGTIKLPGALDKVYIYTDGFGMPCVYEAPVTPTGISWSLSPVARTLTRAAGYTFDFNYPGGSDQNPYHVSSPLGKWDAAGGIEAMTTSSVIQGLTARVQKIAPPTANNSAFAKGKKYTNLVTYKETVLNPTTGKIEGGTELNVKFLWEFAGYHNALGYYYYPKGAALTEDEFKKLPKYIIFPNVSWNETNAGNANASKRPDYGCIPLVEGSTVALMYFGSDYKQPGTTVFPKDIEIGWFMMSDAFYTSDKGVITKSNINGYLESNPSGNKTHYTYIGGGYLTGRPNSIYGAVNHLPYVFSNEEFNTNKIPGCITLSDETSKTIVIGFEDGDLHTYQDMLFYVQATPGVINPGWDLTQPVVASTVKSTYSGALGFEDLWPYKGDYDLNDVIVNYHSDISTDVNNNVTQIVDKFTAVHDGANYTDGFGYELGISPDAIESVTIDRKGVTSSFQADAKGLETNQAGKSVIMLFDNHKTALNKEIVVTIKIKSGVAIKLGTDIMYPPYNPFIVAESNLNPGAGRKEVHLPKTYKPTNLAGGLGNGDDASTDKIWYVSHLNGSSMQYPFAISVPFDSGYTHFIPVTETRPINEDYPAFADWVKSNGQGYKTWYKQNSKK